MFEKIALLLIILLVPLKVTACPHVDQSGKAHLQLYNADYTEIAMIYPQENYLYVKNVTMTIDENNFAVAHEDNILYETYSFPVVQGFDSYMSFHWFLDESLVNGTKTEEDVKTTIKGISNITVEDENYSLTINLSNTYNRGLDYENENTEEIYYDVDIDDYSSEDKYTNFIKENSIDIYSNIYKLSAKMTIVESEDYNYETIYKNIDDFYDEIVVTIKSSEQINNLVVINLDKDLNDENYQSVTENGDGSYNFIAEESGVYVLASKPENVISSLEVKLEDSKEETIQIEETVRDDLDYTWIIIISSIALLLILSIVVFKKLKK